MKLLGHETCSMTQNIRFTLYFQTSNINIFFQNNPRFHSISILIKIIFYSTRNLKIRSKKRHGKREKERVRLVIFSIKARFDIQFLRHSKVIYLPTKIKAFHHKQNEINQQAASLFTQKRLTTEKKVSPSSPANR